MRKTLALTWLEPERRFLARRSVELKKKLDLLSIFPTPNDYRMNYPARKARKSV